MLAKYVGMDVLLGDVVVFGQARAQAGGVQDGARADDLLLGQAGDLGKYVGEDVHGVGHDDVDGVGGVFYDLGGDGLGDVDVGLRQVKTGLAGLSGHAGGQDHDVGILGILIAARVDGDGRTESHALTDVQGLAHCLALVDVDHDHLGRDVIDRHGVGDGGANGAGPDDSNLFAHTCFLHFL